MAKAFLSHSSSDKELVRSIAKQLGNTRCVLDEIVNEFIYRNWKALNSLDDSIDIVSVLNKFLEQTEQIMNKWYEDEMSLLLKKYIM